jgi:hypothetical protein
VPTGVIAHSRVFNILAACQAQPVGAGRGRRLQIAVVAALVAVVVAGASAPSVTAGAQTTIVFRPAATGDGSLTLVSSDEGSEGQSIEVDLPPDTPALPKKVRIDVPRGYSLDLTAKPRTKVGDASISIVGADGPSFATGFGSLIASDPIEGSSGSRAQECAPGPHAAVWMFSTSLAGQQLSISVYVDRGSQADVAYTLQACSSSLASNANSAASISLSIDSLVAPTAPGDYRWRALVTPQTRMGYELQALLPLPEALTVKARYDRKRRVAVLTGKMVEAGKVVPGADVLIAGRRDNHFGDLLEARTNAQGVFRRTTRVSGTTDFTVSVAPPTDPCPAGSTEPVECLGSTTIPPEQASTTLWLSVPTGAVRAIRAADQRRADRAGLAASDFPAEFESAFAGGEDCLNPKHESKLTITGENTSPAFLHYDLGDPPSLVEALGLTRVYATATQAQQAFAHQARTAIVRCVLNRLETGSRPRIRAVRLPRISADVRAFRATLTDEDLTLNYDVVFLQRGRIITILRLALLNAPGDLEPRLTAALAARMR